MKKIILILPVLFTVAVFAQKKETISIPTYVNYKYCKPKAYAAAKELTLSELVENDPSYRLVIENFFIGPTMWERIDSMEDIADIEGGKVTFHVDRKKLDGKYIQSWEDGKIVWDQIRSEFNGVPMRLRKATFEELEYFWAVISYDIVEPLIIGETSERKYIFDLDPKTFCLEWLDEVPVDVEGFLKGL